MAAMAQKQSICFAYRRSKAQPPTSPGKGSRATSVGKDPLLPEAPKKLLTETLEEMLI